MTNEYPTLQALRNETLSIYGLTKDTLSFRGLRYWQLFDRVVDENNTGAVHLDGEKRFEYFKCYVISVAKMINKWYREPDNKVGYDFQIDFLHELTIKVKKYYEDEPQARFFDEFPLPPEDEKREKSIENWLINISELRLTNLHNTWFKEVYERECIDYPAYLKDYREYKKMKKSGLNVEKPVLDTYRDEGCWKSSNAAAHVVSEFMESTFHKDVRDLEEVEEYLILKETPNIISESISIQTILNRFRLAEENNMRKLFNRFHPNDIAEVDSTGMWEVNYVVPDMESIWLIFSAMSRGFSLKAEGKQFLVLQYLTIAIALLKNEMDFDLKSESSYSGKAWFQTTQMQLLAAVVAQSFIELNSKYQTLVLDKFENRNDFKKHTWEESFFRIISTVIRTKLNKQLKEFKRLRLDENLSMKRIAQIPDYSINVQEYFPELSIFEDFLSFIQAYLTGRDIVPKKENPAYQKLKTFLLDNDIELSTIFNFLNPISQKDSHDYDYIIQGAISAITTGIMSQFKKEDGKLQIILTKYENSLNSDMLAKATAIFTKSMIKKDFDIKSEDVSALAQGALNNLMEESDTPFMVSIPEGSEYDSFRMMVDMNGPIKVAIPFTTQGDKPFWDDEKVLNDKIVQMVDKSITDKLNAAKIGKSIATLL